MQDGTYLLREVLITLSALFTEAELTFKGAVAAGFDIICGHDFKTTRISSFDFILEAFVAYTYPYIKSIPMSQLMIIIRPSDTLSFLLSY